MGRSGENFLSVLNTPQIAIFSAFDKNYSDFSGKLFEENLFSHFGIFGIEKCVFMRQIHSNLVFEFKNNFSQIPACDGLFTSQKGAALCVLSADCLPLILWHKSGFIAALHSGREGCFKNILKNCVETMSAKFKLKMSDFKLFILPGICAQNYEIGGEILEFTKKNFAEFLNKNKFNLKALIKAQARQIGILDIFDTEICTFFDERFFSYRRDKNQARFASVVVLKGENERK